MDKYATVVEIVTEIVEEQPPLLYDLTALQMEANRLLGLTASESLKCAQKLYEAGLLTYPRTSSHYITPDMEQSVSSLLSDAKGIDSSNTVINNTESSTSVSSSSQGTGNAESLGGKQLVNTEGDSNPNTLLPKSGGDWSGAKGNSNWVPNDQIIPQKANPNNLSWGEIKKDYGIKGINYTNGEPNFSAVSRGNTRIQDFTTERYKNFKQADEQEASRRGCSPEDVKKWRQENGYT